MLISGFGLSGGVIAMVAFLLRFLARKTSKPASFGTDDYVMAVAMVSHAYLCTSYRAGT